MKEKQFKNLFVFLSILLIFAFPILPLLIGIIEDKPICQYPTSECLSVGLQGFLFSAIFWLIMWSSNYIIFIMEDYRVSGLKSRMPFFIQWYIKHQQEIYNKNPIVIKIILIFMTSTLSLAILSMFSYQIYYIAKILL